MIKKADANQYGGAFSEGDTVIFEPAEVDKPGTGLTGRIETLEETLKNFNPDKPGKPDKEEDTSDLLKALIAKVGLYSDETGKEVTVPEHYEADPAGEFTVVADDADPFDEATQVRQKVANALGDNFQVDDKVKKVPASTLGAPTGICEKLEIILKAIGKKSEKKEQDVVVPGTGLEGAVEDLQNNDKLHPRKLTMTEDCGGLLTGSTIDKDILIREALNAIMFPFHYPVMETSGDVGILDITDNTKNTYKVTIKVTDMGDVTEITSIQVFENGVQVLDGKAEAPRIDKDNNTGIMTFDDTEVKKETGGVKYELRMLGTMPDEANKYGTRNYLSTTSFELKFVYPSFFGVTAVDNVDETTIIGGQKVVDDYNQDFDFKLTTANEFDWFAVPSDVEVIKILDQNSLDITDSYTTSTVSVTFGALTPKDYKVYKTELRQTVADFTKKVIVKK